MATIHKELLIDTAPEHAWEAVRDVGAPHSRLVPGVLVDTRMHGGARVVTFAQGLVARELIVSVDDHARRLAYAWVGGKATHHNASMQVFADGDAGTRLVWITDLLPDELAGPIGALIEQGMTAMQHALRRPA
ncbi:MAG: SRPBCC family protein [Lysobacter sp.]